MQTIEIIGAIIGLLYLYLEYKANKWLWPVGVVMPVVYVWIFFNSKFYADMGANIYYFFASIYGWILWNRHRNNWSHNRVIVPVSRIQSQRMVMAGWCCYACCICMDFFK